MSTNLSKKLRSKIFPIYKEMFEQNKFDDVCTFAIQWGENFPKEENTGLLFVGKAVNGWDSSNDIENLFNKNNPNRIFDRDDQMKWVEENSGNIKTYNTNRSAFWRLIKEIAYTYNNYQGKWYSNIAWTNLYKISPTEGNPNAQLQQQQQDYCVRLLEEEIRTLSPKYVIMLTSGWEDSFIEELKKGKKTKNLAIQQWGQYKSSLIQIDNIKYIISHHPQAKPELEHQKAIIDLINKNHKIDC